MSKRRRSFGEPAPPPDPGPDLPWAAVLECERGSAMDEPDASQWARLSLGIEADEGHLLTVKLRRGDLAFLVSNALHALMMMGDEAAGEAGKRYVEICEKLHGAQRKFRAPFAPVIEPFIEEMVHLGRGYDLSLDAPRLEPCHGGRRGRPFAKATGYHLKVRFEGEPSHRRIALLGGWTCESGGAQEMAGLILLCRWKVISTGKSAFRDFFVLLPDTATSHREVRHLGMHLNGHPLERGDLHALERLKPRERAVLHGLILERIHVGHILPRTGPTIFLAGCPVAEWEQHDRS